MLKFKCVQLTTINCECRNNMYLYIYTDQKSDLNVMFSYLRKHVCQWLIYRRGIKKVANIFLAVSRTHRKRHSTDLG